MPNAKLWHLSFGIRHFVSALCTIELEPWVRRLEVGVDVGDVLHAFGLQPLPERVRALLAIDRNPILPGCAAAEDARKTGACFGRQLERFGELGIADTG